MRDSKGRFIKGHKVNLGHIVSLETKAKISSTHKGKKIPLETRLKMSMGRKGKPSSMGMLGKKMSLETREKMSLAHIGLNTHSKGVARPLKRGSGAWNWKGGVTPENQTIRQSLDFRLWREAVFKRDNYICVWCKIKGKRLHPDHIKMFADYPSLRFEVLNGQTLCEPCHAWKTKWDMRIYRGKVPELNILSK